MTTILLVDDNPDVLSATRRQLEVGGWEVHAVVSPGDPGGYSVALLDWSPHGPEMLERCRAAGVPVVVYTGNPTAVADGVVVVVKPASTEQLDLALRRAIERQAERIGHELADLLELAHEQDDEQLQALCWSAAEGNIEALAKARSCVEVLDVLEECGR